MKSSLRSDEVQGVALDEVKSVLLQPCEAGSHRESDFIARCALAHEKILFLAKEQ